MINKELHFLNDIRLWQQASVQQRETEIAKVAGSAQEYGFKFVEIKQFSVNDLTFDIPVFYHSQLKMQFHLLPGHPEYNVGAAPKYSSLLSQRKMMMNEFYFEQEYTIEITPFFISDYLINQGAWTQFGHPYMPDELLFGDEHPIDAVDREDVVPWAAQFDLRLPSDMEWEYACKAGTNTLYYWGDEPDDDYAWVKNNWPFSVENYRNLTKEEQKLPNAFGLYGMLGNLDEWVADDEYHYQEQIVSQTPFVAFKGNSRFHNGILRGGSFLHDWKNTRSTYKAQCSAADLGVSARLAITLNEVLIGHEKT